MALLDRTAVDHFLQGGAEGSWDAVGPTRVDDAPAPD